MKKYICVENNLGNGNFTKGKVYEVNKDRITCDFIFLNLPKDFIELDEFEFAFCKFRKVN